jgi:ribosome-associated protein
VIDEKQGSDILVLPVGDVIAVTEFFVVTSASNPRLVRAITDAVLGSVRDATGRGPLRSEGAREQQWVLIDYGDVVVHIFNDETRRFYEIERLYKDVVPTPWA